MSGPELPYKISSSEEALACLRKMTKICLDLKEINQRNTKIVDDLREHLRLGLNKVHQRDQIMLQNFKLQMQSMVNLLTVSDLSISKVTSKKIFVSDDLNTDIDPVQEIARVSSETSEFFTPIQYLCDLYPMFVSSNLTPDPSADLASREIVVSSDLAPDLDPVQAIAPVFSETSKFFTPS